MHIILGATGHIGNATAHTLLDAGEDVTAVTRVAAHARDLAERGAKVAEADVHDPDALRGIFRTGRRALLVNPPADPTSDTDAEERSTGAAIVAALADSGLEAILAVSTYGAQAGEAIGDLSTLHEFETKLAAQPIPVRIHRGAYYYTNWDMMLDAAKAGAIHTPFPPDLVLPMVDPADLGRAAAARLRNTPFQPGIAHIEGPERYAIAEVATIFAETFDRDVAVDTVPREEWEAMYAALGFSPAAARAYARMTAATLDAKGAAPDPDERGATPLDAHSRAVAA